MASCRSEFIREAWVWLINPHRTHRRFANKFAPTGGACPLRLTQVFRSFPRSASALSDAERHGLHSHAERGNDQTIKYLPCRSEFIREAWVWLINPHRTHYRFANKFAPTGGARPCGLRRFSDRSHAERGNDQHADSGLINRPHVSAKKNGPDSDIRPVLHSVF